MEILLLIAAIVLIAVTNHRTGRLSWEIEKLDRTLGKVLERVATSAPLTLPAAAELQPTTAAPSPRVVATSPELHGNADTTEPSTAPSAASPAPEPAIAVEPTPIDSMRFDEAEPLVSPDAQQPLDVPEGDGEPASQEAAQHYAEPPPSRPNFSDLEKRFGTQWVVWVGGVALALGGILLVRYSIEQGLFGPGLRVIAGAVLALVLVGLGELARRQENATDIAETPRAHIPSILTAAGTTVAYADIWAAYVLYEFLSPGAAFVLLGLVALATLAAALVHGPALGGLGLVGAYVTPLLVSTTQPSYWTLYVYLAVVTAAAYALARLRSWRWLAVTAAVCSILWVFVGIGDPRPGSVSAHAFSTLVGFALAAAFLVPGLFYGPLETRGEIDPITPGILGGYLIAAFALVLATTHGNLALTTLLILTAATLAVAWRSEAAIAAVPVAAGLAILVVVHWAVNFNFEILFLPNGPLYGAPPTWTIVGKNKHLLFAAGTAVIFGLAGYWSQGRSERPEYTMLWSACAVLTPILILIALYYSLASYGRSIPFAIVALGLAGACALAALRLSQREPRPGLAEGSAIFASGAVAALALALTFALEKGWLTVSLALMAPGIAWIANRQPVPMLRQLCGAIIFLVMVRIAIDPRIVGDDIGRIPIFNWLLWGYGVPAVSFLMAGKLLRQRADDVPARMADSAAILFIALTAMLEIRHLMNDGDIYRPRVGLGELGLQLSIWLAMAVGLEHQRIRSGSIIHNIAAGIFGGLAILGIIFGLGIGENPLITGAPVGGPFFNYVLIGYGIPAVLTAALARTIRNSRPQPYYILTAILGIALALAYLTLQVRTLFHGPVLSAPFVSDAEHYAYSVVWLAFGVALLLIGIVVQSQPARLASAAVVILDTFKVFFIDLRDVEGLYRALSIICLGLVLMGIGWVYQRLLFPGRAPTSSPSPEPG